MSFTLPQIHIFMNLYKCLNILIKLFHPPQSHHMQIAPFPTSAHFIFPPSAISAHIWLTYCKPGVVLMFREEKLLLLNSNSLMFFLISASNYKNHIDFWVLWSFLSFWSLLRLFRVKKTENTSQDLWEWWGWRREHFQNWGRGCSPSCLQNVGWEEGGIWQLEIIAHFSEN